MAIGDDSCSRGHGFESQRRILDEHFAKICIVCLKRPKINEKEAGLAHFLKNSYIYFKAHLHSGVECDTDHCIYEESG